MVMRKSIWHITLLLMVLAAFVLVLPACTLDYYDDEGDAQADYYDDDYYYESDTDVVFDEFEDLQFWGQWFELSPYGWVWRPTVVLGWRPYENGHWAWGGDDWVWVSYEPFGWATYHYGFWIYDMVWGWVWIPDYEWSSARVQWVVYDDYVAWAPLPPAGYRIGEPWIVTEVEFWHVVTRQHFIKNEVGRYHKRYKQNYRIKNRSSVKYKPPLAADIEMETMTTIRPIVVDLDEQVTRGERTVKRIRLPNSEKERVALYRERVERKIRTTDPPPKPPGQDTYLDDRIVPKREQREKGEIRKQRQRKPDSREEKTKGGDTGKQPEKKKYDKKPPTKPVKQEPDKKKSDTPKKTRPAKKKKKNG